MNPLEYIKEEIKVGDIVICLNDRSFVHKALPKTFIALVLDRTYTMSIIKRLDVGDDLYWPMENLV